MSNELQDARADATNEIVVAMMLAVGKALERHGNDPMSIMLLTGATAMFIEKIDDNIYPGFATVIKQMLEQSHP